MVLFYNAASLKEREVLFVFAIVQIGGKQYKVQEGDIIFTEKLEGQEGDSVTFNDVLAVSQSDAFTVGNPTVSGASVSALIVKQGKNKKIYILKYKSKKNEKKRIGHRQPHTKIQIKTITA